jgi:hypothetical protein
VKDSINGTSTCTYSHGWRVLLTALPLDWIVWFDDDFVDPQVQSYLSGGPGRPPAAHFSFEADGVGWFSRPGGRGGWSTNTDDNGWSTQPQELARLRARVPDCDNKLVTILYGKSARIYVFERSFHAELRDTADDYEHPLCKV